MAKSNQKGSTKKRKRLSKRGRTILNVFLSIFLVVFLTGCVVSGYVLVNVLSVVNGDVVINLEEKKSSQNQTSIVYAYDSAGKEVEIARLHGEENRIWVDYKDIPDNMKNAAIALEDRRFKSHHGVDWIRVGGVIAKPANLGQGASSLTQQLIKNLTGDKDVTFVRKYNEILYALNLEKHYSKEIILEAYLNTLYLGSGCYGVQTAAETYFGKDVWDLNLAECAAIISITKAPYAYNPLFNPDKNRTRQLYCLKMMLDEGFINQQEYNEAANYEMVFTNSENYVPTAKDLEKQEAAKKSEEKDSEFQSFYIDYVIDTVISDLKASQGLTDSQAVDQIYYGGLKIYAAVDLDIQKELETVYENRITFKEEKDTKENPAAQSAMTIMDYQGRVMGIIGQAGPKAGKRCLNRAVRSFRQPGSSIKPLSAYAPAVEKNLLTWSTKTVDEALFYNGKRWPRNVNGSYGSGSEVTTVYAIQQSLNTVAARVVNDKVTIPTSLEYLTEKFHLSKVDKKKDAALAPLATGAMTNGVSTLEMAAAYAAFGNGGKYYKPYCYYKVTNSAGTETILEPDHSAEQVISPGTADVMCEMLKTVSTSSYYGKNNGSNIKKFPIMCKTGTTDDQYDRWFAGGTPYYVSAVWYGYDIAKKMDFSVNPAGRIFIEVFDRIHKGLEKKDFPKSGDAVEKVYCRNSGLLAGTHCSSTATGWFKKDSLPGVCSSCTAASASSQSGNGGGFWDFIFGRREQPTTQPPAAENPDDPGGDQGGNVPTQEPATEAPTTAAPGFWDTIFG
ncbi:MAG: transglycosylase domain-containing protein [Clostridiales bacterium]|nr:transglycosylase domain-containing protein [Clostridiales bacterium]